MRYRFLTLLSLALAACALEPTQLAGPEDAVVNQDEVEGAGAVKGFDLHARLALKRGLYRDTMVLDWHHAPEGDQLKFSTPIGTEIGEVTETEQEAVLQWVNQPIKKARRADTLLQESMGVAIPLQDLSRWVQGRFPHETDVGLEGAGADKVMTFSLLGWDARFERWRQVGPELYPGLVTLRQESAEVKMVIDHWSVRRDP